MAPKLQVVMAAHLGEQAKLVFQVLLVLVVQVAFIQLQQAVAVAAATLAAAAEAATTVVLVPMGAAAAAAALAFIQQAVLVRKVFKLVTVKLSLPTLPVPLL